MARHEDPEPIEIVDRLLWRDAQQMLSRHAGPSPDGRCEWCGRHWPCPARRLAERAEAVATSRPVEKSSWPVPHELGRRHDISNQRGLPTWRTGQSRLLVNGGLFD